MIVESGDGRPVQKDDEVGEWAGEDECDETERVDEEEEARLCTSRS